MPDRGTRVLSIHPTRKPDRWSQAPDLRGHVEVVYCHEALKDQPTERATITLPQALALLESLANACHMAMKQQQARENERPTDA